MRRPHLNPTTVASYILFFLTGVIITGGTIFLLTRNVKVLVNWQLILPNGQIHAGDHIELQSTFTKTRNVNGQATRYLVCDNEHKLPVRYPVNGVPADHAPGNGRTAIDLVVPTTVPNTPTRCQFSVTVVYHLYPGKTVTQYVSTKEFNLYPAVQPTAASVSAQTTATSPNQSAEPVATLRQSSSLGTSSLQTDTSAPATLSNSPQPSSDNPQPQPSQQPLLTTVTRDILRVVGL